MIPLSNIQKAIENVESKHGEKFELLTYSILNPIFGFLTDFTGLLNNLRFYSPEISKFEKSRSRQYSLDSSKNSFTRLLIELFPSPYGILSFSSDDRNSLAFKLNQSKDKGIDFLADLFVKILTSEIKPGDELKNNDFKTLTELLLNDDSIVGFENTKMLKLVTIHFFVINILDNQNELENYLNTILGNIQKQESIEVYDINHEIFPEILKLYKEFNSFPYSNFRQPPSNEMIPIFDRSRKSEQDPFLSDRVFPDCADVLLLNICNCLLFNPNSNTYSTHTLRKDSDIYEFYTKNNNPFTITREIRKDWSKVVQGLDDFEDQKNNDKYNTHLIVYKREKRNEIKSGFINMMNILIKLFDVQHKTFWQKFKGKSKLENRITKLFKLITPIFKDRTVTVEVHKETISEFESMNRRDFTGLFDFIFILPSGRKIILVVEHKNSHAEMRFFSCENFNFDIRKISDLANSLSNEMPLFFIKKFIDVSTDLRQSSSKIFENIFMSGKIETNQQKFRKLRLIFKYLTNEQFEFENKTRKETVDRLEIITKNILSTLALDDPSIKLKFMPFLVYFENLTESEVIEAWTSSFEINNSKIHKLWELRIKEMKIHAILINCSKIIKKNVQNLFETLINCPYLYDLKLTYISGSIQESVFAELGKLKKLTSLDISGNEMESKSSEIFAESLGNLLYLEKLDLSDNYINSKNSENDVVFFDNTEVKTGDIGPQNILIALGKLTKIKMLNLSSNNFCVSETKCLSNALKQIKLLEHLNLSNNFLSSKEDVILISSAIGELSSLVSLNLSKNNIGPMNIEFVSGAIAKLSNLQEFRYANTNMSKEGSEYLYEGLKKLKNLKEIDLSFNSLNENGSAIVLSGLVNSNNLQILALTNNNLRIQGAINMANSLGRFPNLKYLDLSSNLLKFDGLIAILDSIKDFRCLVSLDISFNFIKKEGALALAEKLPTFENLEFLCLSSNDIGTDGANAILSALKTITKIKVIDLVDNGIQSDSVGSILSIIGEIKTLSGIYLSKNSIPKDQKLILLNKLNETGKELKHDICLEEQYEYDYDDSD